MEFCRMGSYRAWRIIGVLMLLSLGALSGTPLRECPTVTQLFTACSYYISYGSPDPMPGSPCCDIVSRLNIIANSGGNNKQYVCRCLMGLMETHSPNATAIATLPGFCGVSLGFTIDPNTDCTL
ncbi:putative non-specific lipid-transfer protein 14 [Lotus japonicus]|uniref:putative non-specific lipid-transfer protein 14 n=1 Tax=Lotus japonicus TaxID=34305 RepID=UPI002590F47A|nr:putative non-specific lipid-transfer protein 14 [Lotus japonicus]